MTTRARQPSSGSTAGWLAVAGLGPGGAQWVTPEVSEALAAATDIVGYRTYVARVAQRPGLVLHASDNGDELERAAHALRLAEQGRRVVVVSSGDPGVFAMAAAVFEALEHGPRAWRALDLRVLPGVSAMLAAAAQVGAPLGHDFCAINLSDNLKPWGVLEQRLRLALQADFAIALYNPRSVARPHGFARALEIVREVCGEAASAQRVLVFARCVCTPAQQVQVVALTQARPEMADMQTLVIVGSSQTRLIAREGVPWVYAPRSLPGAGR